MAKKIKNVTLFIRDLRVSFNLLLICTLTALKSKNTFVLADLMKAFMQSQDLSFMPEFIQEVADFKSFIHGYQSSGATRLIGLGEMHLFKFYVDDDGWPVMRYKKSAVDAQWQPLNRPPIRLWVANGNGGPKLP